MDKSSKTFLIKTFIVIFSIIIFLEIILFEFYKLGLSSIKEVHNTENSTAEKEEVSDTNKEELDFDILNNLIKEKIKNTYNINVKYGIETQGHVSGNMSTTFERELEKNYKSLTTLENALSLYPKGFFQEIQQLYSLDIYLVKSFSSPNVTGRTDYFKDKMEITLSQDFDLEPGIHHEIYHYLEKYMFRLGLNYSSWNDLNPKGFVYGNLSDDLAYDKVFSKNAYFVNKYAQTSDLEDRASTFELLMQNKKIDAFEKNSPLWQKAKVISENIDYFFDSVKTNKVDYWERFIY